MITTSKEILLKYNILEPEKDGKKHPKHEFQAYAYRLAHDLNDLQHLGIYLRMAKTIERHLMERAYSFVADSRTNDKGRLFLWKLKKLREEIQKGKDSHNFEYDFVMKKMRLFRNAFAKELCEKGDKEFVDTKKKMFHEFLKDTPPKSRVLLVGNTSRVFVNYLLSLKLKVTTIDISNEIVNLTKDACEKNITPGSKFMLKDLMKNSFKDNYFDIVIVNGFWSSIPFDGEIRFLKEIKRILKSEGSSWITVKHSNSPKEEWKYISIKSKIGTKEQDSEYCYLLKKDSYKNFTELYKTIGFKDDRIDNSKEEESSFILKTVN